MPDTLTWERPAWAEPRWDDEYVRRVALLQWDRFPACPRCDAPSGMPCIDQRTASDRFPMFQPHLERKGHRRLRWVTRCENPDCSWEAKRASREESIEAGHEHVDGCHADDDEWRFRVLGMRGGRD